ncbi:MAG: hypothetical protein RLZZ246_649 [Planctomycetota bacterium]|jgi:hypothetical protein
MKLMNASCLAATMLVAGAASAAEVLVTQNISTSTTWTASNTYNLQNQIYVLPGATLTIEPGTVIASTTNLGGSLAICRGARIVANGTNESPIIFTSKADVATWTGGNPKTGTARVAMNEWGNLTVMGRAYIGKYGNGAAGTNTAAPSASNFAQMEGLTGSSSTDPNVIYGGGDDLDSSGTFSYVSLRYGGKVIGLGNELNGLSLGGIGKETVIDHIEIYNNVDDGIEIWGGNVNLQYFSIWNIGDDSLDIDQGWRGKAQFGLIVQGYSGNAAQGSGVGDNILEIDGAEKSDAQPVTTGVVYNLTCIGQTGSTGGDTGVEFRDNANLQVRNSIFMDVGEQVIRNINTDGEATGGQTGYGHNGTLSYAARWTTPYNTYSTVNPFANPASAYQAQVDGNLIDVRDCVFYNNLNASAYTEANTYGVFTSGNNVNAGTSAANPTAMPIAAITKGAAVNPNGSLIIRPVTSIDPRAANAAVTSVGSAPNDGFYEQAQFRGAFSSTGNWLCGWTAVDAYGINVAPPGGCVVAAPCPADLNGDGVVGGADLGALLSGWGSTGGDINDSGDTDGADLGILLSAWGNCPQ